MSCEILTQRGHVVQGIAPVADAFAGTVYTDIFSLRNYHGCTFYIVKGVGTTGTSTITVEASDDVSGSNVTAIPFRYRANTTSDTWGAVTVATTSGFATTAGSNHIYEIIVDASELGDTGYEFVRLKAVEVVNDPVLAGVLFVAHEPRNAQDVPATVLA